MCEELDYDVTTGVATVIPGAGQIISRRTSGPPEHAADCGDGHYGEVGIDRRRWQLGALPPWRGRRTPSTHATRVLIVLRGDTLVAYSKDGRIRKCQWRLASQRLTIDLAPPAPGAPKGADTGAQISHVRAVNGVRFTSADVDFVGHQIDYDPKTGEMTATGNDDEPAEVQRGSTTGKFRSLLYDVKNEAVKRVDGLNAGTP